jgi:hypothetical protein
MFGDTLEYKKKKLKINTNKFRFYLLMHIEITQHINGDNYGQKQILTFLLLMWSIY